MRNTPILLISLFVGIGLVALLCFNGCGSSCLIQDEPSIIAYHKAFDKSSPIAKSSDSTDVYIDYSDGMYEAIDGCKDFVKQIINYSDKKESSYYNVGDGVKPMGAGIKIYSPSNPSINPTEPKNFQEHKSDLDLAIDQIVKTQGKEAIFITDFELYKNGPDPNPWATRQFTEWFAAKGTIDVFAKPYTKNGSTRHLYVLLFTPYSVLANDNANNVRTRLQKDGYMSENGKDEVVWFPFGYGRHWVKTDDGKTKLNGLLAPIQAFPDVPNNVWDYYCLNYPQIYEGMTDEYTKPAEKYVLNNIVYNSTGCGFTKPQFDLQVEDITNTFETKKAGTPVPDMFEVKNNDKTGEFQICISPKFIKAHPTLSQNNQLFKIQLRVADAAWEKDEAKQKEVLQWNDGTRQMEALDKSLSTAIESNKFSPVLLYTYYIELSN